MFLACLQCSLDVFNAVWMFIMQFGRLQCRFDPCSAKWNNFYKIIFYNMKLSFI